MNQAGMGFLAAAGTVFLAVGVISASAASGQDPDWPCVQRKVPELSLAQIWTGPELPASARQWAGDKEIAALVAELSVRRIPLGEAQDHIRDFANNLPAGETDARLPKLMEGLFDHMNAERSEIMSGIQRYARKQQALAAELRKEGSDLDALRAKPGTDPDEIERRTERLTWDTRIFDERVQSLTYVCEVPTLIEQRLYALAKTVAEAMGAK